MTDEVPSNAIDSLQPGVTGEDARELGAALVRSGQLTVADANKVLTAKGAVPLVEDSLELAQVERSRLIADQAFTDRYLRGEPDAMKRLNELDVRIARGGSKLTDRDAEPASAYKFDTAARFDGKLSDQQIMQTDAELTAWAQSLHLTPAAASALMTEARDADAIPAGKKEAWSADQERVFTRVIGEPNSERVQNASKFLSEVSGRTINVANLVRSAGANVAVIMLLQAEHLAATTKR